MESPHNGEEVLDFFTFLHSVKRRVGTDQTISSENNLNDPYKSMSFVLYFVEDMGISEFC